MRVRVLVQLKDGVLDPQGKAVQTSLHSMGFNNVDNLRVGKSIEFDFDGERSTETENQVQAMCQKILANTVIEKFDIEWL